MELRHQHVQGFQSDRLAPTAKVQSVTGTGLLLYDIQLDRNRQAQTRPLSGALGKTVPLSHKHASQNKRKKWTLKSNYDSFCEI